MKHYYDLSPVDKEAAIKHFMGVLLEGIAEGAVRFDDKMNEDDLQARIDKAWDRAEQMQTPWFIGEFIMDTCADDIRSLAIPMAEDAIYTEDEPCVSLSTIRKIPVEVPS